MPLFRKPTFPDALCLEAMEMLAGQIHAHGAPHLPRVPTVLSRWTPLSDSRRSPDDSRTVAAWADDTFARVLQSCRMDDWTISLVPAGGMAERGVRATPLRSHWRREAPEVVHHDLRGEPVVLYRDEDMHRMGVFALKCLLQLATLRMASAAAPGGYSPARHAWHVASTAVFGGGGLDMLNMEDELLSISAAHGVVRTADARELVRAVEVMTVLAMRARRLTPEQIVASYGQVLGKGFRRRVRAISEGIDRHGSELKLLQRLADGRICNASAQVALRTRLSA